MVGGRCGMVQQLLGLYVNFITIILYYRPGMELRSPCFGVIARSNLHPWSLLSVWFHLIVVWFFLRDIVYLTEIRHINRLIL